MASVSVTKSYDAPREALWNIFADYGKVSEFHPGIESSKALNRKKGLGGMRACEFGGGRGVTEEITTWEKGARITFTGTEFRKMPLRQMAGHFHFDGDNPTTVTFVMDYKTKGGIVMDFMARRSMRKASFHMLEGAASKL